MHWYFSCTFLGGLAFVAEVAAMGFGHGMRCRGIVLSSLGTSHSGVSRTGVCPQTRVSFLLQTCGSAPCSAEPPPLL